MQSVLAPLVSFGLMQLNALMPRNGDSSSIIRRNQQLLLVPIIFCFLLEGKTFFANQPGFRQFRTCLSNGGKAICGHSSCPIP